MIYISQGHENGIGLEVFLKSFLCLSQEFQNKFFLVTFHSTMKKHQEFLDIQFKITTEHIIFNDHSKLNCKFLDESSNLPQTTISMSYCLDHILNTDILLTLPSSKDQFFLNDEKLSGHTEFFRKFYNIPEVGMTFLAKDTNVLLLTDHIAIEEVISSITKDLILKKVALTLGSLNLNRSIKEIFFSGINPHCGEGGEISNSDLVISESIKFLRVKYPNIIFHEMLAGDTLHFNMKTKDQLFIYAFHDQGLAPFKLKYGLSGINFSSGLPFKRVSVDHGTSFPLFGNNSANYTGMLYLLSEIESWT